MDKFFSRKACLKYIIECSTCKQYQLAQKIYVTSQQFTKYYQGLKPVREDAIPILEKELGISRELWLDNRRRCLMLTDELKAKIDEQLLYQRKDSIINFNDAEESFKSLAEFRMLIGEFTENLSSFYISTNGEIPYDQVSEEVEFYRKIFKLRKNSHISREMWSQIIDALDTFLVPPNERILADSDDTSDSIKTIVQVLDSIAQQEDDTNKLFESLWGKDFGQNDSDT